MASEAQRRASARYNRLHTVNRCMFWRSVNLTGNQTPATTRASRFTFWRSVNLTGNQTPIAVLPQMTSSSEKSRIG